MSSLAAEVTTSNHQTPALPHPHLPHSRTLPKPNQVRSSPSTAVVHLHFFLLTWTPAMDGPLIHILPQHPSPSQHSPGKQSIAHCRRARTCMRLCFLLKSLPRAVSRAMPSPGQMHVHAGLPPSSGQPQDWSSQSCPSTSWMGCPCPSPNLGRTSCGIGRRGSLASASTCRSRIGLGNTTMAGIGASMRSSHSTGRLPRST